MIYQKTSSKSPKMEILEFKKNSKDQRDLKVEGGKVNYFIKKNFT